MWQKGCALLVGLVAVLGFGWVSAQEPSSDWSSGASYILKAGDHVKWPSGHSWYFWITSTNSAPLKVTTTNSSGKAIYAKAPSGGYALYADGRLRVNGTARVDRLQYNAPRSHLIAVPPQAFVPDTNDFDYWNGTSAYLLTTGSGTMVAPIMLPQGAVVTRFKVYLYDNSLFNVTVYLSRRYIDGSGGSGVETMASLDSSGIAGGLGSKETSTIDSATVDNATYSYLLWATSSDWDNGNVQVEGANIWYTTTEAQ